MEPVGVIERRRRMVGNVLLGKEVLTVGSSARTASARLALKQKRTRTSPMRDVLVCSGESSLKS
eukprot:1301379-Pleurochrysis_carterae.AAC.1